jgi:thiamine kinase-like enzyme
LIERGWPPSRIEDTIRALPIWQGEPVLEPLIGGMQNTSYTVTDEAGTRVARLGFDNVHLGTVQTSVLTCARAAAEIGISPPITYYEPNLFVMDFIAGRILTEDEIAEPAMVGRIIDELLAPLHAGSHAVRDPAIYFDGFLCVRNHARYDLESSSPHRGRIPEVIEVIDKIEPIVEPYRPVFCHNDIAHVNIMLDHDDRLWLIDWDFGGFNHPMWDIAELCAYAVSDETLDRFVVERSLGALDEATMTQRLREHRAFKLASYLRQFTWCILQDCEGSRTDEDAARGMTRAFSEDGVEDSYEGFMELAWGRYRDLWQSCRDDY